MGNRKLIYFFAVLLSGIFTVFYYAVFTTFSSSDAGISEKSLYMNQVGLYAQADSVNTIVEQLKSAGLDAYTRKSGDVTAVMTGVSTKKKDTKAQQETLTKLQYSFVLKKITTNDPKAIEAIDKKDYAAALEQMKDG